MEAEEAQCAGAEDEHGADRGARRDAEHVGVGKRVADHGPRGDADGGEAGADYRGEEDAREAQHPGRCSPARRSSRRWCR